MGIRDKMSRFWSGNQEAETSEYDDNYYDWDDNETYPEEDSVEATDAGTNVTELPALSIAKNPTRRRIVTLRPNNFDEATQIADILKAGDPVILNLSEATTELSRRLVDFSSAAVYVLGGQIETITPRVYLLSSSRYQLEDPGRDRIRRGQ